MRFCGCLQRQPAKRTEHSLILHLHPLDDLLHRRQLQGACVHLILRLPIQVNALRGVCLRQGFQDAINCPRRVLKRSLSVDALLFQMLPASCSDHITVCGLFVDSMCCVIYKLRRSRLWKTVKEESTEGAGDGRHACTAAAVHATLCTMRAYIPHSCIRCALKRNGH